MPTLQKLLDKIGTCDRSSTKLSWDEGGVKVSVCIPIFAPNLSNKDLVKAGRKRGVKVRKRTRTTDVTETIPPGAEAKAWVELAIRGGK